MYTSDLTFKSLNETLSFRVQSESEDLIMDFTYGLYELFVNIETGKIEGLQKNDAETNSKINIFLNSFKQNFPPILNKIISFFKKLEKNEHFLFIPSSELTIEMSFILHNYLLSLKGGESFEKLNNDFESTIGNTLKDYDLKILGHSRIFIGKNNNKICRFCGKNEKQTTFKNKAHAISEGLGNKKIFLYEECDSCNDKFSIEIEPDLINYFSIFRTFYDVKGKGGNKKIKGKDFEISKDKSVEIKFQHISSRPNLKENPNEYNLALSLQEKINSQDIYRCLAKFCMSVIEEDQLDKFSKTISWINKGSKIDKLPKIGELISYNHFTKEPKLILYTRKNGKRNLPYMIGEFHLTCKILTFIIPGCSEDDKDFTDENNFSEFWKNFHHFSKVHGWTFNDYSVDKDRDFTFNLSMNMGSKNEL